MDKREVMPSMRRKRPGFDLAGKKKGNLAGARHSGGRFTWNGNSREELLCRKRAIRIAWLSMGRFWTVKGHWAKKRVIFGCKVLGAAVSAAETYACKKKGGEWTSETVVESAAPRALADSACFSGGACGESGGCRRCCVTKRITRNRSLRFLVKEVLEEKGGLCEGANPFAVAFHRDVHSFEGVTGTEEELYEALRRMVFSRSSWHSLRRGSFFFFAN